MLSEYDETDLHLSLDLSPDATDASDHFGGLFLSAKVIKDTRRAAVSQLLAARQRLSADELPELHEAMARREGGALTESLRPLAPADRRSLMGS